MLIEKGNMSKDEVNATFSSGDFVEYTIAIQKKSDRLYDLTNMKKFAEASALAKSLANDAILLSEHIDHNPKLGKVVIKYNSPEPQLPSEVLQSVIDEVRKLEEMRRAIRNTAV
jgi:hypothetical protein